MSVNKSDRGSFPVKALLRAVLVWFFIALALSFLCALILSHSSLSEQSFLIGSAAITFLSALAAGAAGNAKKGERAFLAGSLCLLLLLSSLIASGFRPRPAPLALLLLLSFIGCLLGAGLPGGRRSRKVFRKKG